MNDDQPEDKVAKPEEAPIQSEERHQKQETDLGFSYKEEENLGVKAGASDTVSPLWGRRKHESAIVACCLALERYIDELRATLLEGKPPESAGIAGKPLPLPQEETDYAAKTLDELQRNVEKIKGRFGHGLTDRTPSLSLTYMWASVLLGRMEEVAKSLEPGRLERTRGEMPARDKEFLERIASGNGKADSTADAILHHKE